MKQESLLFIGALSGKTISIVCRTLFETGCRIGELHQIERTDVNEERWVINIRARLSRENLKPPSGQGVNGTRRLVEDFTPHTWQLSVQPQEWHV